MPGDSQNHWRLNIQRLQTEVARMQGVMDENEKDTEVDYELGMRRLTETQIGMQRVIAELAALLQERLMSWPLGQE